MRMPIRRTKSWVVGFLLSNKAQLKREIAVISTQLKKPNLGVWHVMSVHFSTPSITSTVSWTYLPASKSDNNNGDSIPREYVSHSLNINFENLCQMS